VNAGVDGLFELFPHVAIGYSHFLLRAHFLRFVGQRRHARKDPRFDHLIHLNFLDLAVGGSEILSGGLMSHVLVLRIVFRSKLRQIEKARTEYGSDNDFHIPCSYNAS